MALLFTATKLTKNNLSVRLEFNLVDDLAPLTVLGSGEATITLPTGQTENALRAFIGIESLKCIQSWYNIWKATNADLTTNQTRCAVLSTYVNSNIVL